MVTSIGSDSSGFNFPEIDLENLDDIDNRNDIDLEEKALEEELNKNVTHVILLLNHLFSKLELNMTKDKKEELANLKSKIHKNTDTSQGIYNKRAWAYSVSAYLSFAASITTSLCPNADQDLVKQINNILGTIEKPLQNFSDGKLGKLSTCNQIFQTEITQKQDSANKTPISEQLASVVAELIRQEMSKMSK